MQFDETFDVVVAGFGLAGGIAAITAAKVSVQIGDRGRTVRIPALPCACYDNASQPANHRITSQRVPFQLVSPNLGGLPAGYNQGM